MASSALLLQWEVVAIHKRWAKEVVCNVTSLVKVRLEVAKNESTAALSITVSSA